MCVGVMWSPRVVGQGGGRERRGDPGGWVRGDDAGTRAVRRQFTETVGALPSQLCRRAAPQGSGRRSPRASGSSSHTQKDLRRAQ